MVNVELAAVPAVAEVAGRRQVPTTFSKAEVKLFNAFGSFRPRNSLIGFHEGKAGNTCKGFKSGTTCRKILKHKHRVLGEPSRKIVNKCWSMER